MTDEDHRSWNVSLQFTYPLATWLLNSIPVHRLVSTSSTYTCNMLLNFTCLCLFLHTGGWHQEEDCLWTIELALYSLATYVAHSGIRAYKYILPVYVASVWVEYQWWKNAPRHVMSSHTCQTCTIAQSISNHWGCREHEVRNSLIYGDSKYFPQLIMIFIIIWNYRIYICEGLLPNMINGVVRSSL